eukprot:g4044.t1
MSLRRRMLWYLKGFICLCCRCSFEAAYADPARTLGCSSCGQMTWQFLPGFERHAFSCSCGKRADDAQTKNEQMLSSAVLGALCARWSGLSQAESALTDLQDQVSTLHEDHFAVRCLQLLFLALEGDEFLSSKRTEGGDRWLRKVYELGQWQERIRPRQHGGMLLMLSFKSLAPTIRLLSQNHGEVEVLRDLSSWAASVLVLGCEHAAPLPCESLESLVQLCRSLLMSFDSASMDLGLRLASCLCEAGGKAVEKLHRHGVFKMLPHLAATPELLHQPPRPQHIRLAAAKILSKWSDAISQEPTEPSHVLANAEEELRLCTPNELIRLEVPQKLLRERTFQNGMPKDVAAMLLQAKHGEARFCRRLEYQCIFCALLPSLPQVKVALCLMCSPWVIGIFRQTQERPTLP